MHILRSPWAFRRADGSLYGSSLNSPGLSIPSITFPTEATSSNTALGSTSTIASLTGTHVDSLLPTGASNSTDPGTLPLDTGVPSTTTITLASAIISTTSVSSPNGDNSETADTETAGSAPSTDWFASTDSVTSSTSSGDQPRTTAGAETTLVQVVSTVSVSETPWTTSVWVTPLGPASATAAGSAQPHNPGQSAAMVVAICIAVVVAFLLGVAGWRLRALRRRRMEAEDDTDDLGDGVRLWQEKEAGETGVNAADGLLPHEGQRQTVNGHSVLSPGWASHNGGDQSRGVPRPNPDTRLDDGAGSCASSTSSYINTLCPETASRSPNSPATYNPHILSALPPILPTEARLRPLPAPTMPSLELPLPARPMYALSPEERASVWSMMNVRDSGIDEILDVYHEEFDLRPPEYSRY